MYVTRMRPIHFDADHVSITINRTLNMLRWRQEKNLTIVIKISLKKALISNHSVR